MVKLGSFLLVAMAAMLVHAGAARGEESAPARGTGDRIWIGPMPFKEARTLRDDWFPVLSHPEQWAGVLGRANVFKSYLMVLPDVPVEGKTAPELTDEQMAALASLLRERKVKVAFEVGGLRLAPSQKADTGWGERQAAAELRWLKRWIRVGGKIDYLTTDHAVMMNIGSCYVQPDNFKPCGMEMPQVIEELVDYFEACHKEIPEARLGCIESLGFFHVHGPDGRDYPRTVPALPVRWFNDYLDMLLAAMKKRGLALDHFHIDFGYEGVRHDGGGGERLDFGRVLGVERYCQSKGVKAGVIVNAFHNQAVKPTVPAAASREAYDYTLRFAREYLAAGGKSEHFVVQTWMPYPDHTGPEDTPYTVLNIARDVLAGMR